MEKQSEGITYRKANDRMEIVRYRNWTKSYVLAQYNREKSNKRL